MMTPQEAADELRNTANTFEQVVGCELTDMSAEWLAELDTLVMLCDICGWWCDADEINDDQTCIECAAG